MDLRNIFIANKARYGLFLCWFLNVFSHDLRKFLIRSKVLSCFFLSFKTVYADVVVAINVRIATSIITFSNVRPSFLANVTKQKFLPKIWISTSWDGIVLKGVSFVACDSSMKVRFGIGIKIWLRFFGGIESISDTIKKCPLNLSERNLAFLNLAIRSLSFLPLSKLIFALTKLAFMSLTRILGLAWKILNDLPLLQTKPLLKWPR